MKVSNIILSTALSLAIWSGGPIDLSAQMAENHQMSHTDGAFERKPVMPGQDAFGAVQEIVGILEQDRSTDWARVDIGGLRAHLVDMNRLIMDVSVIERPVEGGLDVWVSGSGATRQAIRNMVPAHAPMIDSLNGWKVKAELTAQGARLTVTSQDAREIDHIRGLGFFGLMVTGSHHQSHHLSLARGENVHAN